MKLIKDGVIFETPIYKIIDGVEVELTQQQLLQLGYSNYDNEIRNIEDQLENKKEYVDKLQIVLDSISVELPEEAIVNEEDSDIELPFKLGYTWKAVYDPSASKISYQLVPTENAIGAQSNPIFFYSGVKLVPGAYYFYNGKLYTFNGSEIAYADGEFESTLFTEATTSGDSIKGNTGTETNPIVLTSGVELIPNAYYLIDGVRHVYMGAAGTYNGNFSEVADYFAEF